MPGWTPSASSASSPTSSAFFGLQTACFLSAYSAGRSRLPAFFPIHQFFSLTPQAGAETIGSNENITPKKNGSKPPQGSCQTSGSASKDLSAAAIIVLVVILASRSKKN